MAAQNAYRDVGLGRSISAKSKAYTGFCGECFAPTLVAHVLAAFPLVSEVVKVAAQNAYRDVRLGLIN